MIPLSLAAAAAAAIAAPALAQSNTSNTPPYNSTATNPWWPDYPVDKTADDYILGENASEADLRGETDVAKFLVEASTMFRAQFGSAAVTWNETAARIAQNHTLTCLWEHWGNDNLAQQFGSEDWMRWDVSSMVVMWATEWDYYPFSHPEQQAYSHFTAMVWNESTTFGCGWNVNCVNDTEWPSKTYFVCNYWPPPNIITTPPGIQFAQNVGNYTGWPVDAAKASSIAVLTAGSNPTSVVQSTTAVSASATGTASRPGSASGSSAAGASGSGAQALTLTFPVALGSVLATVLAALAL